MSLSTYSPRGKETPPPPGTRRPRILETTITRLCTSPPGPVPPTGNPHGDIQLPHPTPFLSTPALLPSLLGPCKLYLWPRQEGLLTSPCSLSAYRAHSGHPVFAPSRSRPGCWSHWLGVGAWSAPLDGGPIRGSASLIVGPLCAENLVFRKHLLP